MCWQMLISEIYASLHTIRQKMLPRMVTNVKFQPLRCEQVHKLQATGLGLLAYLELVIERYWQQIKVNEKFHSSESVSTVRNSNGLIYIYIYLYIYTHQCPNVER